MAEYIRQNTGFVSERTLQDWPLTFPPRVATPLLLVLTSVLAAIASLPGLISHRAVKGDQDEPGRVGPPWKLTAAARFTASLELGNDAGLSPRKWEHKQTNKKPLKTKTKPLHSPLQRLLQTSLVP